MKTFLTHFKHNLSHTAQNLVKLLQKKGDDFSEHTNLQYVEAMLRIDRVDVLIFEFSEFWMRMGAWSTDKSVGL